MKTFAVVLILLFAVSAYAYAQSVKEAYELQERCGKRAQEVFNKEYGNGNLNTGVMATYTNHYNRKLNKCFVIVKSISYPKEKNKWGTLTDKSLWDINEMKDYGEFVKFSNMDKPSGCYVLDKRCNSEIE